jgi:hypothetical protein
LKGEHNVVTFTPFYQKEFDDGPLVLLDVHCLFSGSTIWKNSQDFTGLWCVLPILEYEWKGAWDSYHWIRASSEKCNMTSLITYWTPSILSWSHLDIQNVHAIK